MHSHETMSALDKFIAKQIKENNSIVNKGYFIVLQQVMFSGREDGDSLLMFSFHVNF